MVYYHIHRAIARGFTEKTALKRPVMYHFFDRTPPVSRQNKGPCRSRSLCRKQGTNSALGELRGAAGGLQTVLNQFFAFSPVFSRVSSFCLAVFPYELTHQLSRFFFTICAESLVYHRCQFPRLIVLHLGVNVHSHLAVLVPSQILNSLWIDAFMNQIRDIGVPEKMRRHMKIQSIVDVLVRSAW